MSSSLEFIVSLTDRVTAPLKNVQSKLESFNKATVNAFKPIAAGAIATWGIFKSLVSVVEPAEEMERALRKAGLSGITSLDMLRQEAKKFSGQYGTSALDFVNSASLVKNALTGISDKDLPKTTAAINLLSKATGDSMETSSAYISQMLSNYKNVANKMGQLDFTKRALGVAAYAKQNLNVSTDQLRGLIEGTNNAGGNYGVDMGEQTIVLSMLSKSLGGGASGAYENFYKNLSKAGKELGMSFTDANGKMLAMPEIVTKIQTKFGKNLAGNVKAQQKLDKVFGDGAKVIGVLSNNSDELNKHMKAIGGNKGFEIMQKMAEANVKPLDRINAQFNNIKESLGRAMLPVLTPILSVIGGAIDKFAKWMDMFPNIAKWIGIISLSITGLAAAAAVIGVITGVMSLMMSPIILTVLAVAALVAISWVLSKVVGAVVGWIIKKVQDLWTNLKDTTAFKAVAASFEFIQNICSGVWDFITSSWNGVISFFSDNSLSDIFDIMCQALSDAFTFVVDWLSETWDDFIDFFSDFSFIESFTKVGDALMDTFSAAWKSIKNMGIGVINSIIEKLNRMPGVNIELIKYESIESSVKASVDPAVSPLKGSVVNNLEPGGLSKEIRNSKSQSVDNSQNINSVVFNVDNPMTPAQLQEWNYIYAG